MTPVNRGKTYSLTTANGNKVPLVFCHFDQDTKAFVDGITSEELISALIDRHGLFLEAVSTQENENIYTFLKQVRMWLDKRNQTKRERKKIKQNNVAIRNDVSI